MPLCLSRAWAVATTVWFQRSTTPFCCGEYGEFHTFAYDGPMFDYPVPIRTGEVVRRDGFVFAEAELAADAVLASPSSRSP